MLLVHLESLTQPGELTVLLLHGALEAPDVLLRRALPLLGGGQGFHPVLELLLNVRHGGELDQFLVGDVQPLVDGLDLVLVQRYLLVLKYNMVQRLLKNLSFLSILIHYSI